MLKSQVNANVSRFAIMAAVVAVVAFAVMLAVPRAAYAEGDQPESPPVAAFEEGDSGGGENGSSDDTPTGGADEQGDGNTDSQQGGGDFASEGIESDDAEDGASTTTSGGTESGSADLKDGADASDDAREASGEDGQDLSGSEGDTSQEGVEDEAPEDEAQEARQITVTFSDGAATTSATAKAGENVAMPAPTREGYTLAGWALAGDPGTVKYAPGESYAFTESAALVAVWQEVAEDEAAGTSKPDGSGYGEDAANGEGDGNTEEASDSDNPVNPDDPEAVEGKAAKDTSATDGDAAANAEDEPDELAKLLGGTATAKVAKVQYMTGGSLSATQTSLTAASGGYSIDTVFSGAAYKGNLYGSGKWSTSAKATVGGTVNYDTWWAFYTTAQTVDIPTIGVIQVQANTLLIGAFDYAGSNKEVSTWAYMEYEPYDHGSNNAWNYTQYNHFPWNNSQVGAKTDYVVTLGGIQPLYMTSGWFSTVNDKIFPKVKTFDVRGLDTSKCESFASMFYDAYHGCTVIGLETLDTTNVMNYDYMFGYAFLKVTGSLTLDFSGWNMNPEASTSKMFVSKSSAKLSQLTLGDGCFLEGTTFSQMGGGVWYIAEMEDSKITNYIYPDLLVDADGFESLYRKYGRESLGKITWKRLGISNYWTITYNANGGSGKVAKSYAIKGSSVALASNAITKSWQLYEKTGYLIRSWNTNNKGTGTTYALSETITPTSNMTLYAVWKVAEGFKVRYDTNGGAPNYDDMETLSNGNLIKWTSSGLVPSNNPEKNNYTFSGWYVTNENGQWIDRYGAVQSAPKVKATSSSAYSSLAVDAYSDYLYLKAYWEEKSIKVSYTSDLSSQVKVKLTGATGSGSASATETKKPESVGFAGATATIAAGYHSLYWISSLYPSRPIYGESTFDSVTGAETNVLSAAVVKQQILVDGVYQDGVIFTLKVEGNEFTLHFNPNFTNDGVHDLITGTVSDIQMRYGQTMYLPSASGSYWRDEYIFQDKWANYPSREAAEAAGGVYKEYDRSKPFVESSIRDQATYELYAVWKMRTATATFRADWPEGYVAQLDGNEEVAAYKNKDWVQTFGIISGTIEEVTAAANPGYSFQYWIDDVTKAIVSTKSTWAPSKTAAEWPESMAFRAKYSPITYVISFDANGGVGSMEDQSALFGRTITLRANALDQGTGLRDIYRDGYIFDGWSITEDGTGTSYKDQGQVKLNADFLKLLGDDGETVTLYAKWTPRPITVRYNAGAPGVSNSASYTQRVRHEVPFTLAANSFNRYGYSFEGWAYSMGGAKEFDDKQQNVVFDVFSDGSEVDLYALWSPVSWTVTFANENEEAGSYYLAALGDGNTLIIEHADAIGQEPSVVPNTDKTFMGWKYSMTINAAGTKRSGILLVGDVASFEVIGDVTLTATWGPSDYYVRYLPGKHGLFNPNLDSYTYWTGVKYGDSFYPDTVTGQGGYTYNGGVDSAETNPVNIGKPMGEAGWEFYYWSWYDENDHYRTTLAYKLPTTIKGSYVFTAHWKPTGLVVSFDANGGAPAEEDSLEPIPAGTGETHQLPGSNDVVRAGFKFLGWSSDRDGSVEYLGYEDFTVPDNNLILYALWDPYRLTLRFDTQGGSAIDDSIDLTWESVNLLKNQGDSNYQDDAGSAEDVATSKPGFEFAGWFVDLGNVAPHLRVTNESVLGKIFAEVAGEDGPSDGDVFTLYALWTPKKSTLHYIPVYEDGIGGKVAVSNSALKVQPNVKEVVDAALGEANEHEATAGKGYSFMYWADAEGNILSYEAVFKPVKDTYDPDNDEYGVWDDEMWFYAVFGPVIYTLCFDANGGVGAIDDVELEYAQTYMLPTNSNGEITSAGYAFMGWMTEPDGGKLYDPNAPVSKLTEDLDGIVILYARWTLADQSITFHDNYSDPEQTAEFDVAKGQKLYLPNDMYYIRDHYRLVGWNTKADGTGTKYNPSSRYTVPAIEAAEDGTRNIDLYAMWLGIGYSVRFNANAGDVTGKMADEDFVYGTEKALSDLGFKRQGYTFVGWTTDATLAVDSWNPIANSTRDYQGSAKVLNLTEIEGEIINLYALWHANENEVIFTNGDATYGNVVANPQKVVTGGYATYNASSVTATPSDGQSLAGWTYVIYADGGEEKAIETGTTQNPGSIKIIGKTVFTALWSLPNRVQYLPGTQGDFLVWTSDKLEKDATIPAPPNDMIDTETGKPRSKSVSYEFIGWRAQNGTIYDDYEAIVNAGIMVTEAGWIFEAQWKGVSAPLSFDSNGGTWTDEEGNGPSDVTDGLHGQDITLPEADVVSRIGYVFDGWSTAEDDSGVVYPAGSVYTLDAHVQKLYAHWAPKSYTVYYDMGAAPSAIHDTGVTWDTYVAKVGEGWLEGSFFADHVFAGWALNAGDDVPADALLAEALGANGIKVSELLALFGYDDTPCAVTLYAIWKVRDVTIDYIPRGSHGTVTIVGFEDGSANSVSESFPADGRPRGATAKAAEGYRFVGWYDKEQDDEDGAANLLWTDETFIPGKSGLTYWSDATYYAWFLPFTYTIVFDANDPAATAASTGMPNQTMTYDEWESLSARGKLIVNPGYSFREWTLNPDGTGRRFNDQQMVLNLSKDDGGVVTLYAQWNFGDYSVVFDKNAEDAYGEMDDQPLQYGVAGTLNANEFLRNGYKLVGWSQNAQAAAKEYDDGGSILIASGEPEASYTLYAVWAIADNYTLRFENAETDKGSLTDDTGTVPAGDPIERTVTFNASPNINDITVTALDGWTFAGWNIEYYRYNERGSSKFTDLITSNNPASINSYAINGYLTIARPIWAATYSVTFAPGEHGDFSAQTSLRYVSGSNVPTFSKVMADNGVAVPLWSAPGNDPFMRTAPKSTDDSLYAFAYWQDDFTMQRFYSWDDLEGLVFGTRDITLTAVWVDAMQDIVYDFLGYGDAVTVSARANTAVKLYDNSSVSRSNMWIAGWSTESYGDKVYEPGQTILMPVNKLKLYAIWRETTVIVKYKVATDDGNMGRISGPGLRKMDDGTLFQEIGIVNGWVYDENGQVISRTPYAVYANPNPGYLFTSWMYEDSHESADQAFGSTPFVVSKDRFKGGNFIDATFWATFRNANEKLIQYEVRIDEASASAGGSPLDAGTVSLTLEYVDPREGIPAGSTASANDGWIFDGWYLLNGDKLGSRLGTDPYYQPSKGDDDVWPEASVYVALFKTGAQISYAVEYWLEDEEGVYTLHETDSSNTAAYGATVTGEVKQYEGWTYNDAASKATKSAKLDGLSDVTLVLYYSRARYAVIYEYKDGVKPNGAVLAPSKVEYRQGETVQLEAAPSYDGFTFVGWKPVSEGDYVAVTVKDDGSFEMPMGKVLFRGEWVPLENTLYFDANGGVLATDEYGNLVEAVQPKQAAPGATLYMPTNEHVYWDGRVLVGWSVNKSGPIDFTAGQSIYMPYDMPDVKKTFYAIWREKTVEVRFNQVIRPAAGNDEQANGMLEPYNGASFIIDDGEYVMLVGAVSGKVYAYYNPSREVNATPYEIEAAPANGYALVGWEAEDGTTLWTGNVFGLTAGSDGLYHAQTITAVFAKDDDVTLRFT